MLIIEGADCVGKTTLMSKICELLAKHGLAHDQKHMTRPDEDCDHYHFYAEKIHTLMAWDRFHLGELVYRKIDERKSSMTPMKFDLVEALIRHACGFVIIITADADVIRQRFGHKLEMYDLTHALRINELYCELAACRGSWVMRGKEYAPRVDYRVHDSTNCDVEGIVDMYISRLKEFMSLQ